VRGLHLLIELARRTTDERRGSLGHIAIAKAIADAALAVHEETVAKESTIATNDSALMVTLREWSNHTSRARAALKARRAELVQDESIARDALQSAFVDLKRLEIARDSAARQQRIVASRSADNQADEQFAAMRAFGMPQNPKLA